MAKPRLTADELRMFKEIGRQYPRAFEVLTEWRMSELEKLPMATGSITPVGVLQGRAQVLTEMQELFDPRNP